MSTNIIDERLREIEARELLSGSHESYDDGVCIMWPGRRDQNGYGWLGRQRAHRVVWEQATGRVIPPGMVIMHTCDNPPCVNPAHLRIGTVAENNADRAAKGRSKGTFPSGDTHPARLRRGERHWSTKLTDHQVREIRRRRKAGEGVVPLANAFGVSNGTISRIARGVWRQEVS